ncbi:MAG: nucleoside-diphosphate sugar epimerase/dehydratase [Pseudomonadota bacterium]
MYKRLTTISRTSKKAMLLIFDIMAVMLAVTLAIVLRTNDWPLAVFERSVPFYTAMVAMCLLTATLLSIPQTKLSAFDLAAAAKVGVFAMVLTVVGTVLNLIVPLGAPRTVPVIAGMFFFCMSVGWKLAAHGVLAQMRARGSPGTPVAVYGAGAAGIQLMSALNQSTEFRVVAVVDDNPSLRGVMIGGLRVQSPGILTDMANSGRIDRILLALPSVSKARQQEIVRRLEGLPCEVQALPAYADIINQGGLAMSLKPVSSDDLLGRDKVDLDIPEIATAYKGKSVLISGAGGSIGSELCRQVLSCAPRCIVLFERSEFALYSIDREIRHLAESAGVEVFTVLGSVTDQRRVTRTLKAHKVEIVLHAAAYKHVPLVETNEQEGVRNNIFGTQILADAARSTGVERFILISTDKAVRPTNVMGATKRLAEMTVQDLARRAGGTRFAMVRFGNVLGSSGSVIPLFQSQIAAGGPITVTHPDVTRFFMTMPEAARLVLLAGSFSEGGDVFVLDMGKPVKIMDLAHKMIELSGLSVKDADQPDGDIAIEVTGLRPGEKLFEELLIDDEGLLATPHPKILRAEELCPSQLEIATILQDLDQALGADSALAVRRLIGRWVEGYADADPAVPPHVAAE